MEAVQVMGDRGEVPMSNHILTLTHGVLTKYYTSAATGC